LYQLELETILALRSSEAEDEEVDMPRKQHSGEEIIGALKQYEAEARPGRSAESWGSARLRFTYGSDSTPG
jgi:hypothetical protein